MNLSLAFKLAAAAAAIALLERRGVFAGLFGDGVRSTFHELTVETDLRGNCRCVEVHQFPDGTSTSSVVSSARCLAEEGVSAEIRRCVGRVFEPADQLPKVNER